VIAGLACTIPTMGAVAAPSYETTVPSLAEIAKIQQRQSVLLEAHLAAMKAGLKLSDDQAKTWEPFEAAIRDAAKARFDRWTQARERMSAAARPTPIERLSLMADHLQSNAEELRKVADAGKPLYDGLTDAQKLAFGPLMREFKPKHRL
jgi:zinc resistance-associated protein